MWCVLLFNDLLFFFKIYFEKFVWGSFAVYDFIRLLWPCCNRLTKVNFFPFFHVLHEVKCFKISLISCRAELCETLNRWRNFSLSHALQKRDVHHTHLCHDHFPDLEISMILAESVSTLVIKNWKNVILVFFCSSVYLRFENCGDSL